MDKDLLLIGVIGFSILEVLKMWRANLLLREINKARTEYKGRTKATVSDVKERGTQSQGKYYYPQFFYEVDGRTYWGDIPVYTSRKRDYVPGSAYQIRYDEKNPESFMLADDREVYDWAYKEKNPVYT